MTRLVTLSLVVPLSLFACATPEPDPDPTDTTEPAGDTTPPQVTGFEPVDEAARVAVDAEIRIEFSEPVDADSAEVAVQLLDESREVALDVAPGVGDELVFTPVGLLDGETEYTVVVGTELTDLAGNPLETEVMFDFTTADVDAPRVIDSLPAHDSIHVDIDGDVVLTFSEPLDLDSVTFDTVVLHPHEVVDGVAYKPGAGMPVDLFATDAEIRITPRRGSLQEYETTFDVIIDGVEDLSGNVAARQTITFTTILLDSDYLYRILNAQFHTALDTFSDSRTTFLIDTTKFNTSGSYWYASGVNGAMLLRNQFLGDAWYLEGGTPGTASLMTKGSGYTGQIWTARYSYGGEPRVGATIGESPAEYYLTNANIGKGTSLGVLEGGAVGLDGVGFADQAWYFRNEGLR